MRYSLMLGWFLTRQRCINTIHIFRGIGYLLGSKNPNNQIVMLTEGFFREIVYMSALLFFEKE